MTSKGLELQFEEQMNKPKEVISKEPEINEKIEVNDSGEESKGFTLDDW